MFLSINVLWGLLREGLPDHWWVELAEVSQAAARNQDLVICWWLPNIRGNHLSLEFLRSLRSLESLRSFEFLRSLESINSFPHLPSRPAATRKIGGAQEPTLLEATWQPFYILTKKLVHKIAHFLVCFFKVGLKRTYGIYKFLLKRRYGMYKFRLKRTYGMYKFRLKHTYPSL